MVVEDAVVLGTLFSHLSTREQVGSFLSAYQELREARTKAVLSEDIKNGELVALPHGPARDERNANMAPISRDDEWDEGVLKQELDAFAEVFCYEAADAAEEWWVDWGRFSQNSSRGNGNGNGYGEDAGESQSGGGSGGFFASSQPTFSFGAVTSVTGQQSDED
ncbi:hypothetical protein EIP91_005082 [Steccherinum ochraceum]|uniref:Uncharacterized protein n=1 Tax=Steccherinum ochraceum TaxID=92696 RepID=A0A4R0R7R1_9APHY|nr:hypothetical protein EIP91_005082 [Steccherinum ochraceum]